MTQNRTQTRQHRRDFSRLCVRFPVFCLLLLLPGLATGSGSPASPDRNAGPQRIVSICIQGDQLLLQLVKREQIVALSCLAADPDISPHWEEARGIPSASGEVEELMQMHPDLVLAGKYTTRTTVAMLKQLGVPVFEIGVANDFAELRVQIREVAARLGAQQKAEAIIGAMDARLARLSALNGSAALSERPTAMLYFQDGFTPGGHTFANALLEVAGFRNLGANFSAGVGASAPLEGILMAHPQNLILTRYHEASPTATQVCGAQPLFQKLGREIQVLSVSFRHLACPDPSNLELAEMLHERLIARAPLRGQAAPAIAAQNPGETARAGHLAHQGERCYSGALLQP